MYLRRHQIYRYLPWLLPLLAAFLTACGDKGSSRGIDGYVYVAEKLPMPGGGSYVSDFKVRDGYFYYQMDDAVYCLLAEELSTGESSSVNRKLVFNGNNVFNENKSAQSKNNYAELSGYALDGEGAGYYALMEMSLNLPEEGKPVESMQTAPEIVRSVLVKQQADGTERYRLELGKLELGNVSLAVDGDGRVFLLTGEGLHVVGADGKLVAEIPGSKLGVEFQAGNGRLLEGEGGSVYYSPSDVFNYNVMYEISGGDAAFREGTFRMERIELPSYGRCYSAPQGILCGDKNGMLYRYRKEEAAWETLLRFEDSNLTGQPEQILWLSDESMLAYYIERNFNAGGLNDYELYLMTKMDASLLSEEEELVLAVSGLSSELEKYIAAFNRTSGRRVTVEYYQGENYADRLDAAMVSSHPPDLIVMDDAMAVKFAGKGLLEDLSPYLEKSEALDREDFLENVLAGYTMGGRLVCIPDSFIVYATFGRTSQVGTEAGWTAAEAMAFAEAHPDAQIFRTPTFTSMSAFFQEYILESYIDWESGECSFDGEEFHALVKWMEAHSDGFGSGYAGYSGDSMAFGGEMIPEGQLLSLDCFVSFFRALFNYEQYFGEDITAIGHPTSDGRALYTVYVDNAIGIAAGSKNKEEAWRFIEGFLAQEKTYDRCFPSRIDLLRELAEEEMAVKYSEDEKVQLRNVNR